MRSLCSISIRYCLPLLITLWVFGLGCSDDNSPPCSCHQPLTSSLSADQLINYVLKPALDHPSDEETFPQRIAALRQAAPTEENDSAYWQWYYQTLATTCAVTEYRHDKNGAIFLSWDFSGGTCQTDSIVTSGQLTLYAQERGHTLTIEIRTKELTAEQYRLTGLYQSVWRMTHSSDAEPQYELRSEVDRIVAESR